MDLTGETVLYLKAVVTIEPGGLVRVLRLFDERNVVPRRVNAQRIQIHGIGRELLQIEIELTFVELTVSALRSIAAKIAQMPSALSTVISEGHRQAD